MDSDVVQNSARGFEEGHRTVTESAVHTFARLTGDYSRMHLDYDLARTFVGGRPIARGLLSACWALGVLTRSSLDPLQVSDPRAGVVDFRIRLQKVVSVGDTLAIL